jgi:hypothetical protein
MCTCLKNAFFSLLSPDAPGFHEGLHISMPNWLSQRRGVVLRARTPPKMHAILGLCKKIAARNLGVAKVITAKTHAWMNLAVVRSGTAKQRPFQVGLMEWSLLVGIPLHSKFAKLVCDHFVGGLPLARDASSDSVFRLRPIYQRERCSNRERRMNEQHGASKWHSSLHPLQSRDGLDLKFSYVQ